MYLMTDILKWVKVSVLDIELSLYYAPLNCHFLEPGYFATPSLFKYK